MHVPTSAMSETFKKGLYVSHLRSWATSKKKRAVLKSYSSRQNSLKTTPSSTSSARTRTSPKLKSRPSQCASCPPTAAVSPRSGVALQDRLEEVVRVYGDNVSCDTVPAPFQLDSFSAQSNSPQSISTISQAPEPPMPSATVPFFSGMSPLSASGSASF